LHVAKAEFRQGVAEHALLFQAQIAFCLFFNDTQQINGVLGQGQVEAGFVFPRDTHHAHVDLGLHDERTNEKVKRRRREHSLKFIHVFYFNRPRYNTPNMLRLLAVSLSLCLLTLAPLKGQSKRAMTYADVDAWRSISGQRLSPDGKYLAYGLFPQDGNGEVIVRTLATGKDLREAAGARPAPPPPDPDREGPPLQRTAQIAFSADSRFVAFSTFPTKEAVEQARKDRKKESEQPKGGLVLVDLNSGAIVRVADVKSYAIPADASNVIVFLKEDKQLVLHRLSDGVQKAVAGVTEFTLSKDGQTLVYATETGVSAQATASFDATPQDLINAKGKYTKLTWDEKQTQLAFLSADSVYHWDRRPNAAKAVVSNKSAGLGAGMKISDRGALLFARDGSRLFFPTAIERAKPAAEAGEKVNYDLWHWKDDVVQPMQKVRASQDRNRSYRAVFHIAEAKIVQLGDATMQDAVPNETGLYAIGTDDRGYRGMVEYDSRYTDQYLVNTVSGERRLLGKQRQGPYSWSPDGRFGLRFEGKDWFCLNVATAQEVNLTSGVGVNFFNEEHDSPSRPNSYGFGGWTRDAKYVLLNDRFDVWQISPDGKLAKNLTDGFGRKHAIQLRVLRTDARGEGDERLEGLDPAKPLLLRGESVESRGSGFFTDTVDGTSEPRQLVFADRNYSNPVKARNSDTFMLTSSTYREYPDIVVTDGLMRDFKKVTDANPQLAGFQWGNSELVNFRSNDGIALKAALYKPENFDPSKKYPLMVYIYERLSQNVNNFAEPRPSNSISVPIYVSNGYLVLTPDIAYKTGYPGDSAMNCVLPAIQKLIDMGIVDEKRIGIQGHSWGGYQIAYMVTRTNIFRAAGPGAVVANMISAYDGIRWGTGLPRQFQYEKTQSRIGGTPWQYPLRFIENSPIFRADQIQTPLLMMHNDADDAVPWYQGIEFYLALRRLNKEVYMFNYNGEPHNLRIRANQKHYASRLKEFFDFYLMDAPKPAWMEKGRPFLEREPSGPARPSDENDENEEQ
jgi:dipeptidyl aminopeptidase/acylaminoacyl peptidase